jgi:hypothetical protein
VDFWQAKIKKEIAMKKIYEAPLAVVNSNGTNRRHIFFLSGLMFCAYVSYAQTYPQPEFTNEVYFLKKDNSYSLVRLEKSSAKQETKVNMIKGSEMGYEIEGKTSPIRLATGANICFVYTTTSSSSNSKSDSIMRANGMDPNAMTGLGNDPSSAITLYKLNVDGGSRKIYLQKQGGYFGSHKNQTSDKYTFSLKKIRDGYWELVIDKPLPKGEYAFSMTGMGAADMMGAHTVYAFGVD